MKIKRILLFVVATTLTLVACTPENNDNRERVVCDFEGEEWSALIDNVQYNGEMLYGGTPYEWYDAESDLAGGFTNGYGDNKFWGGCSVISNYVSTDYLNNGTYEEQMTAYTDSAFSGSNFLLLHGSTSIYGDLRSAISFKSGAKQILSAQVCLTTYMYYVATTDNHLTAPLDESGWIYVKAEGYIIDDNGAEQPNGKSCTLYLFRNGKAEFLGWKEWNLSSLGKVDKVRFDFKASDDKGEGSLYPAYLAMDDIVVLR